MGRGPLGDRMRIVMVVTNPFKPDPRVYKEAKSLTKAGHEVIIVAWDREGKYPKEEKVEGFKVIRVGPRAKYGPSMAVKLPLFYFNAFRVISMLKPDVIHTHDFDTAVLGLISKKLRGTKWVYDVHDLYESLVKEASPIFSSNVVGVIDAFFQKNADVILTASHRVSEIIFRRNKNVYTVLNTVPPIPYEKESRSKMFTVFYGGVISGHRFLLEMAKISKKLGIKYRVAGKGWEKIEQELKKQLNHDYLGFIPHKEVLKELSKADITFAMYDPQFENNRLSIPNKIFEAASVKTPILVSHGTALAELVETMKIGWAVKYDEKDVEKMLSFLLLNPKYLKKSGHKGHKIYLKKYTWNFVEQIILSVYSKVVKNHV